MLTRKIYSGPERLLVDGELALAIEHHANTGDSNTVGTSAASCWFHTPEKLAERAEARLAKAKTLAAKRAQRQITVEAQRHFEPKPVLESKMSNCWQRNRFGLGHFRDRQVGGGAQHLFS